MTNLYLRDSLLMNMTRNDKTRRGADSTRTDHIGKVFIVVGQDERKCLTCDSILTRRDAAAHSKFPCYPQPRLGTSNI